MVARQEKAQCVSWFIETKSYIQFQRRYRTSLSVEKIHHHALQFVDGARNLWRQGQRWMQ